MNFQVHEMTAFQRSCMIVGCLLFLAIIYFITRKRAHRKGHDASASLLQLSDEQMRKGAELLASDYARSFSDVGHFATGCKVTGSKAGNSGFILYCAENKWVSAYVKDGQVRSSFGKGAPSQMELEKLSSSEVADGSNPFPRDYPYANEENDISEEVRKSHGHTIAAFSIGSNSFNFGFENDYELDFQLIAFEGQKPIARVYWENWSTSRTKIYP